MSLRHTGRLLEAPIDDRTERGIAKRVGERAADLGNPAGVQGPGELQQRERHSGASSMSDLDQTPRIDARASHLNVRQRPELEQGVYVFGSRPWMVSWAGRLQGPSPCRPPGQRSNRSTGPVRGTRDRRGECHRAMGTVKDQDRRAEGTPGPLTSGPGGIVLKLAPAN